MQLFKAEAETFGNLNSVLLHPGQDSNKYISDMI